MNKKVLFSVILSGFVCATFAYAEDQPTTSSVQEAAEKITEIAAQASPQPTVEPQPTQAEVAPAEAALAATPVATVQAEAPVATDETEVTDNLEFVSGEISTVDEPLKIVTVKLYGETENEPKEKTISVKIDDTTDITDGEKDRDFKSLTPGTEVDVEYDPSSSKATYIFVY